MNGTLDDFDTCGTFGWKGNGTSASPYRVEYKGATAVTEDRLTTPSETSTLDPSANDFTTEVWVRFNSLTSFPVIARKETGTGTAGRHWITLNSNNSYKISTCLYISSDGGCADPYLGLSTVIPATGSWHHIVLVHNNTANTFQWYINGTESGSGTMNPDSANGQFLFGGRDTVPTQTLDGALSIMRIYQGKVFTQAEARQNCHAQKARFADATCAGP